MSKKEISHNLFNGFPEWFIDLNAQTALMDMDQSLMKINAWRNGLILDLVRLYDIIENDRKISNGEVTVKACCVFQEKLIENILGMSIKTARSYLRDIGVMFAVRREVYDALFADAEWSKRFDKAKTTAEIQRVLSDFCRAKGLKVVEVKA